MLTYSTELLLDKVIFSVNHRRIQIIDHIYLYLYQNNFSIVFFPINISYYNPDCIIFLDLSN